MTFIFRLLRIVGLAFLALIILYAIGRPTQVWLGSFYSGVREPYLQMPSSDAVTIKWQSEDETIGVVRYGLSTDSLDNSMIESEASTIHEVRLTGLKSATRYFYSIGKEGAEIYKGTDFTFKTAPKSTGSNSQTSVRLWVTGDQGYPNPVQNQVRDAALKWSQQNPHPISKQTSFDFWLTTGDNAYTSGTNKQFQAGFFEPYKLILRNTPVWPAYGNHDARRWAFFDIFSLPTQAESGGIPSGTENYYSFDYANIHVVMLDSEDNNLDTDSEMMTWLKRDLAETQKQWVIAVFHHPPYTKGSHNSDEKSDSGGRLISVRENIVPLLEAAGVDLVLSGHTHMYERSELIACHYSFSNTFSEKNIRQQSNKSVYFKKDSQRGKNNGTIYSVVGSSSKVDMGPLDHPAMPFALKEAGSMIIDVTQNKLKARFINNETKVRDQFEIVKGASHGVETQLCQ